jgi:hypothetical protein
MRQPPLVFFAAFSLFALTSPGAQSQSLGQALHDAGYTETVWVNSFDRRLTYLAHGVFNPATPIHNGDYNARYGMSLSGSGTVSIGADGYFMATGTATNPNAIATEGDVSIDFLKSGQLEDTAEIPFTCAPLAKCPWQAEFTVKPANSPHTSMRAFTVRVYRHVEGSVCGGELTPDLNSGPCHSSVVTKFGLSAGYVFTNTDITDTNYLAKPAARPPRFVLRSGRCVPPAAVVDPTTRPGRTRVRPGLRLNSFGSPGSRALAPAMPPAPISAPPSPPGLPVPRNRPLPAPTRSALSPPPLPSLFARGAERRLHSARPRPSLTRGQASSGLG